jgi:putative flippase GtrA
MLRNSAFVQRALKFTVSGVFVTALHAAIAAAFIEWVWHQPSVANGLAFCIATVTSYLINTWWSFATRLHGQTLVRFLLVAVLGLLISMLISAVVHSMGYPYWVGIVAVNCVIPPTNFLLHNFWTYRNVP